MTRGCLVALLLVASAISAPDTHAQVPTICTGTDVIRVRPGLSMTPSSGTMKSVGNEGAEECHGPMDGHQPTGTITVVHSAHYGYVDPDTCSGIEAKAYAIHSVPTARGVVRLVNHFTASANALEDGVMTGAFEGDRLSGRFALRPLEGDCVNSPLTLFEGIWEGTWHGKAGDE
jgi:hypothetical protein